jgi:hypothetical protein
VSMSVITVKHADLTRADDNSVLRSICPECKKGLLAMRRNERTHVLLAQDSCLLCGQGFVYSDIVALRKKDGVYIPLDLCKRGHVYRVRSRNLRYAVFDGEHGFIGIRTKFGDRYLFTEDHWDTGEPHGTVKPYEDSGPVPDGIEVSESSKELMEYLAKVGPEWTRTRP